MEGLNRPLGAPPVPSVVSNPSDPEDLWQFPDGTQSSNSPQVQPSNSPQSADSLPSVDPAQGPLESPDLALPSDHPCADSPPSADSSQLPGTSQKQDVTSPLPLRRKPWRKAPAKDNKERYIAIGIDFGTTYSGVSWACSFDPENIQQVKGWPSANMRLQDEVQIPTQINLKANTWGYLVSKQSNPIRWFKLLLLDEQDVKQDVRKSSYLTEARNTLRSHPRYSGDGIIDLVAQFLKELWDHSLQDIGKRVDVDKLPLRVAVTVPAIWPSYARARLKEAARRAGIERPRLMGKTKLTLVEEPEAAALCTLHERREYPEIEVGETFIVCDCGGGTVDIISYRVKSTDPFQIEEAVRGDGKLCGAFLADSAFERWIKAKSGLKFDNVDEEEFRAFLQDEWEYTMKRAFSGKENQSSFAIRPPSKAMKKLKLKTKGGTFPISKDTLKEIYSKPWNGTRELISGQEKRIVEAYGKPPKKILLVGGLGASPYLYWQLHAQFHGNVLQPSQAWSAVAKGAVIAVLESTDDVIASMPVVVSRVARFSYGVQFGYSPNSLASFGQVPGDRGKDEYYFDPDGTELVRRMTWYLKKDETLDNRDPVTHTFSRWVRLHELSDIKITIFTSHENPPPFRRNNSVKLMCEIGIIALVPWETLERCTSPSGEEYRNLHGVLTMRFEGEPKWSLQIGQSKVERDVKVRYEGV
ncbi:hypothetical protein NEUTE1DRAFT_81948 [Neurospora tetrasperma FGSC 2508]|uniref:Actin-like ATPase domain-containing protein n=1 Tax=Neurospora tetrasperma (strain FGSC 2508 / ATCC MYA-4615 / P0657) TaxID=510951 RepID=F8MMN8_NEUT8|nr:uncharacterized protein NEUTE1DRAFT_81948 [Neurospora tetrasperma FGSC 2508]EGO57912.1 hypothetical protein NEUTE1DRAFT_81948 [Neurospora tetrasperma FGSC 2508]